MSEYNAKIFNISRLQQKSLARILFGLLWYRDLK